MNNLGFFFLDSFKLTGPWTTLPRHFAIPRNDTYWGIPVPRYQEKRPCRAGRQEIPTCVVLRRISKSEAALQIRLNSSTAWSPNQPRNSAPHWQTFERSIFQCVLQSASPLAAGCSLSTRPVLRLWIPDKFNEIGLLWLWSLGMKVKYRRSKPMCTTMFTPHLCVLQLVPPISHGMWLLSLLEPCWILGAFCKDALLWRPSLLANPNQSARILAPDKYILLALMVRSIPIVVANRI